MAKIIVESWAAYKVIKSKKITLNTEDLKQNFVTFENMTNDEIAAHIEDYEGIIEGEHLREYCIHSDEEETEEFIPEPIAAGTTVHINMEKDYFKEGDSIVDSILEEWHTEIRKSKNENLNKAFYQLKDSFARFEAELDKQGYKGYFSVED